MTKTFPNETYDEAKERAYLISSITFVISFFAFFFNAIKLREANVMTSMSDFIIYTFLLTTPVSSLVLIATFEIVDSLQTRKLGFSRLKRFLGRCLEISIFLFPYGFLFFLLSYFLSPFMPEEYTNVIIVLPVLGWTFVMYKLVTGKKTKQFFSKLENSEW